MKTDRISDTQDHITPEAVHNSATSLVPAGSVLLVVRSGILKHTLPVAVTEREVSLNQDLKAVTPSGDILPEYLALGLKAFEREILHQCCKSGTTVQNLEMPVFLRFELPVAPLPTQRRIVAEIEKQFTRLDAGVAALRRVQANLKRYRAAVLKAACEGRLVPTEAELARTEGRPFESGQQLLARILTQRRQNWQGRGKYKEPDEADTSALNAVPEGWAWSSLSQTAGHITDGTHKTPTYVETGVPFLSAKDISGFRLSFDKCRYVPKSEHDEMSKRCSVNRGSVLITKSGTIGRVAVVETDDAFSLFESVANVPVIPPMNPKFVSFAAFVGIAGVFGAANQKGVAVRHLHLEDLRRVPIPLPPLAEQTRIVAEVERRLSVVEELEAVITTNLQRATRLRQSILTRAFTGELTAGVSPRVQQIKA